MTENKTSIINTVIVPQKLYDAVQIMIQKADGRSILPHNELQRLNHAVRGLSCCGPYLVKNQAVWVFDEDGKRKSNLYNIGILRAGEIVRKVRTAKPKAEKTAPSILDAVIAQTEAEPSIVEKMIAANEAEIVPPTAELAAPEIVAEVSPKAKRNAKRKAAKTAAPEVVAEA